MSTRKHERSKLLWKEFLQHKRLAKYRGIPFEFTYAMFELKWVLSGKWHLRGAKKGHYVMSRYNDTGPYSWNNTFIQTHGENIREWCKGKKLTKEHRKKLSVNGKGKGSRPVLVDGVRYDSIKEAAEAHGVHPTTVSIAWRNNGRTKKLTEYRGDPANPS